jgi:hypothetical protein
VNNDSNIFIKKKAKTAYIKKSCWWLTMWKKFNKLFYIFNKIIKTSIYFNFFNFYKITEKIQLISGETTKTKNSTIPRPVNWYLSIIISQKSKFSTVVVIYITNAVGYILQRQVFRLKHDCEMGVFKKTERCKMPTSVVMY